MEELRIDSDLLQTPKALQRFLSASRWSLVEDEVGEWEVWRAPNEIELQPPTITLLFDDEYVDFDARLREANRAVLTAYKTTVQSLAEQISSLNADLFFLRIEQDSMDGTISFKQAQRALDSIATMVKAAATTVSSPDHSHRGRRPAEVESFISDDLRLGHTKKGSFVVTAAARLDWSDTEPDTNAGAEQPEQSTNSEGATEGAESTTNPPSDQPDAALQAGDVVLAPFGRRVMTTLSLGLDAARRVAHVSDPGESMPIGEAAAQGLTLEMVEALEKITKAEGIQSVSISFDWSPAVAAPPESVPSSVAFGQAEILELPTVSEKLQLRAAPEQVEIIGPVSGLSRPIDQSGQDQGDGEVVIHAEIDGRLRKVTVPLNAADYDLAVRAHLDRIPITVAGELIRKNSLRLGGYVTLERKVLQSLLDYKRNR